MEILVTGFEPYLEYDVNPSGIISKMFNGRRILGCNVTGITLPVAFRDSKRILEKTILELKPKIILSLGLSPNTTSIVIERVAINLMESSKPDKHGYTPTNEPIFPDGPVAYFTNLPVFKIKEEIERRGIPVKFSFSAGTYICNLVMYTSLHVISVNNLESIAGFMHIPLTPDIAVKMPEKPSMSIELMERAVETCLKTCIREVLVNG